jgi:hypothetical protein
MSGKDMLLYVIAKELDVHMSVRRRRGGRVRSKREIIIQA